MIRPKAQRSGLLGRNSDREEDLISADDRGGMPFSGTGLLPLDVLNRIPLEWGVALGQGTV